MLTFSKIVFRFLYFYDFTLAPANHESVVGGNKKGILRELRYLKGVGICTYGF
jgi:hypothetical protein